MQALPAANPIAPVAAVSSQAANTQPANNQPLDSQPAKATSGASAAGAAAPEQTGQANPVSFEQVLATQIDAETLRPDLILEAANADLAEDDEIGQDALALLGQEGLLVPQLAGAVPDPQRAAMLASAEKGDGADLVMDGIGKDSGLLAGARSASDRGADLSASEPIEFGDLKGALAKGVDTDSSRAPVIGTEATTQSQTHQGTQETQRTQAGVRGPEAAGFNPRVIPEPVRSPQWSEALGQRVVWMAKENVQVVYLQVDPPNLGPIEVQLRLSNDQANLMFVSAHSAVRDAINGSLPKLDELLSAGGVSLGSVSVNTQSPSQDSGQHGEGRHADGQAPGWEVDARTGEAARPARPLVVGLVDTFA